MNTFQDLNLPVPLQEALVRMNYAQPTEIQAKAIPIAMQGHDILGSAQTGTGKTAAFSIPLINKLIEDPNACALIMTPTRELAEQVITVLHQLLNKCRDIKTALLIGGMPIQKQFLRLKENPRIIVGTPGRINDHLDRRSLNFKNTRILVLDEADRMLDMGFGIQLEAIAKHLPTERQTFMFSATLPKRILSLSEKFMSNPQRIKVGATHAPLARIKQDVIRTTEDGKYASLLKELDLRTGSVIIFAKTKRKVDQLAKKLNEKMGAGAMHGDLRQHQRTRILKEFRDQKYRVLVATDVAARGLDIPHIEHVINYDLPQAPEDYIHRIGRTARGLAEGSALCFISREDEKYWRAIERLLGGDESGPSMQRATNNNSSRPQSSRSGQRPGFGARPGAGSRGRFSDGPPRSSFRSDSRSDSRADSRSDARPDSRSRFSDRSSAPRSDARPEGRSRFSDRSAAPRSDARPEGRSRFSDRSAAPRSDARPEGRSRFSDRSSAPRSDARPEGRSHFSDRSAAPRSDARPEGRSRFSDRSTAPRSDARPEGRSRFPNGNTDSRFDARTGSRSDSRPASRTRSDAKPAARQPSLTKKPYGPQNRPFKEKKPAEERLYD
ncbi:MAG: DEAD/DEAH box helicase [Legionellales bacterium]|jgi:superfamily II DNA/RNA helicase